MHKIIICHNITSEFLTEFFIQFDRDGDLLIPDIFLECDRTWAENLVKNNSDKIVRFLQSDNSDGENNDMIIYIAPEMVRWNVSVVA